MTSSMIEIEKLTKRYGLTEALKGLSFQVPKGQVVGFLGPNGAGKSTTMRILAGFASATSGVAKVAGIDVSEHPVEARRRIGYLPENNPLYEEMMVLDFLGFIAEVREVPKAQRRERIRNAIERCGLQPAFNKDIGQLSKGFRQRVGLAQAILHEPDLLILDEPTSGLDPNQIVEIRSLIKQLGEEKTVILSTHILSEVQSTCSRALIINDGKLVADDSPEHLAAGGAGGSVSVVLGSRSGAPMDAALLATVLRSVPGVTQVETAEAESSDTLGFRLRYANEDPRRALFEAAVKNDLVLLEVKRTQASLEDTFRKLTSAPKAAA
ncbi:MAG: ATP-binding cassette domain-containing protein [Myxococcaceae bacterium]